MILMEGLFLILFSQMNSAMLAILVMTIFALFTHMACGATYALAVSYTHLTLPTKRIV